MVEDVVRSLGYLSLGTRLKRIAEKLQAEAQAGLSGLEPTVPAGQQLFLAVLDHLGPLSIGELAGAIGIAQPGVTRAIGSLAELGLVHSLPIGQDQRRRVVALTPEGQTFVDRAKPGHWQPIEATVASLCADLSGPFIDQLDALEDNLSHRQIRRMQAQRKAEP